MEETTHIALHLHILNIGIIIQRRDLPRLKLDQVYRVGFPSDGARLGLEVFFGVKGRECIFDLFRGCWFLFRGEFWVEGVGFGEDLF
jgi:hypothetical protein